jgi:putative membrane protein
VWVVAPSEWSWNGEAVLAVVLGSSYAVSLRRFPAGPWRVVAFGGACVLLFAVFVTPLDTLAREYLVLGHLWQNVVLAEWAPLLLVLGIGPGLAHALTRAPGAATLTMPYVALPLWVGTYLVWHVPAAYDGALRHPHSLLPLEHLTYLAAGVLMWWPVFQDVPRSLTSLGRTGYVFAAFVLSAPLGLVLALVPEPIYSFYADAPERVWGLSRLSDQQLGGISMAGEQSLVFFAVFAYWFARFLADEERAESPGAPIPGTSTAASTVPSERP